MASILIGEIVLSSVLLDQWANPSKNCACAVAEEVVCDANVCDAM